MLGKAVADEGILRRRVEVDGATGPVPGVVFTPTDLAVELPVVMLGHGGGTGKDDPRWQSTGRLLAETVPAAVLCIDAPLHGERSLAAAAPLDAGREIRRALSDPITAVNLAADWRAALDELRGLDGVRVDRRGYFGFSMGTMLGVPVCADLDVRVAVFAGGGVFDPSIVSRFLTTTDPAEIEQETKQLATRSRLLVEAAARLERSEILQLVMLDDAVFSLDDALQLFNAFPGSKRLAAWPGGHDDLPPDALELAAWFLSQTFAR